MLNVKKFAVFMSITETSFFPNLNWKNIQKKRGAIFANTPLNVRNNSVEKIKIFSFIKLNKN